MIGTNIIRLSFQYWINTNGDLDISPQWKLAFHCFVGHGAACSDSLVCSQIDVGPIMVYSRGTQIVPAYLCVILTGVTNLPGVAL